MKKIILFLLTLSLTLGLLTGCGGNPANDDADSPPPPGSGGVLKVFNWGDYIDPSVNARFEQETGIRVVYSMFEGNEDMYAVIRASGDTSYDVVIPSDYMIQRMIREVLLRKINFDNVPNYQYIDSQFKNLAFDPNNEYSVPYMWGTLGIVYNTTMVDAPIKSWSDLWNPTYSKNLFMMDSVRDSFGLTLKMLGGSMNTQDQSVVEAAFNKLVEQKPLVLAYTGDEVKDKMISGEAAMAVVYSGDAITIRDQNPDIDYVIPSEGSNLWVDSMCILASAENPEAAEKYINFMCSDEIARLNFEYISFCSPQTNVRAGLSDEQLAYSASNPSEEELARCEVFEDLGDTVSYYNDLWTRLLAS